MCEWLIKMLVEKYYESWRVVEGMVELMFLGDESVDIVIFMLVFCFVCLVIEMLEEVWCVLWLGGMF